MCCILQESMNNWTTWTLCVSLGVWGTHTMIPWMELKMLHIPWTRRHIIPIALSSLTFEYLKSDTMGWRIWSNMPLLCQKMELRERKVQVHHSSHPQLSLCLPRGTRDQYITHRVGVLLRLTELFGGQIFNDVYMMNFTPNTPEWLNTGADYL